MSGTGQTNASAPTRLTPIVVDQPITDPRSGQPTPFFAQSYQRILSYLGQPATTTSGSTGNGLTITEQINTLTTQIEVLQAAGGGSTPQSGIVSRLASIEISLRNLLRFNRPPPVVPDFTGAQMLSWWRQ